MASIDEDRTTFSKLIFRAALSILIKFVYKFNYFSLPKLYLSKLVPYTVVYYAQDTYGHNSHATEIRIRNLINLFGQTAYRQAKNWHQLDTFPAISTNTNSSELTQCSLKKCKQKWTLICFLCHTYTYLFPVLSSEIAQNMAVLEPAHHHIRLLR